MSPACSLFEVTTVKLSTSQTIGSILPLRMMRYHFKEVLSTFGEISNRVKVLSESEHKRKVVSNSTVVVLESSSVIGDGDVAFCNKALNLACVLSRISL